MKIAMIARLLAKRRQLLAHEDWTRQQLEAFQVEALGALRKHTYTRSPFYQQFHKGLYEASLHELPALSKEMLMEHFDELVTDRKIHLADVKSYAASQRAGEEFLGRYRVQSTSGTSGHPGLFLYNQQEWSGMLAAAFCAFQGAGIRISLTYRTKMAQITSTNPSHMSMQGSASMGSWWMPMLQLAASEPVTSLIERLNDWQPEAMTAYASIIRILAEEQIAGRLHIAPRTVISGSEVLTPETRRRAVQAWGNVLFNMYGTTDCGGIGAECDRHRGMHLREDLAIVEVVDRENRPVATGEYGDRLLVTVLGSRTQPLIRYQLDDSLRLLADPCPCGRPFRLIGEIQGRVHEILEFPAAFPDRAGSVKVHPIVFHNIMDTLPVGGWQVVQQVDGLHLLLADVQAPLDEAQLADRVTKALTKQGVAATRIHIQRVDSIPQTAAGKTPLVKSNLH